jgi:hypothetical protein
MFPTGKVTMSDAEYTALMEHDAKQAAKITEQRARIAFLEERLRDINEYNECGSKDKDIERLLIACFPVDAGEVKS